MRWRQGAPTVLGERLLLLLGCLVVWMDSWMGSWQAVCLSTRVCASAGPPACMAVTSPRPAAAAALPNMWSSQPARPPPRRGRTQTGCWSSAACRACRSAAPCRTTSCCRQVPGGTLHVPCCCRLNCSLGLGALGGPPGWPPAGLPAGLPPAWTQHGGAQQRVRLPCSPAAEPWCSAGRLPAPVLGVPSPHATHPLAAAGRLAAAATPGGAPGGGPAGAAGALPRGPHAAPLP